MDKSQKKKGKKKAVIKDLEEKDAEKVKGGVLSTRKVFPKVEAGLPNIKGELSGSAIQFPKVE